MKKTILSLLSMAFISAMTLTSCDEIMSKMDNPVDSYLKVDAEVFVKEGSAVELYAETISDAEVTYTVGDEKIAKVEKVSNHEVKVIGVKPGETVIDVKLAANAYYKAGEAKVKVVVDPTYTLKDAVVDGAKLKIGYKFNGEDYIFAYGFDADKKEFNALDENNVPKAITNLYDITITYDGDGKITQKLVSKADENVVPFELNLYTAGSFDRIYKLPIELKSVVVNNYDVLPYVPESVTPVDQLVAGLLPDNMEVGDKGVYPINFFPDNATNQVIKYTSTDANVISIDAAGNIEAKAAGTATIKAEATDGTGKFVQHTITVVKTIILEPNIWDIDGARFAAYVWNSGSGDNNWYLFGKVNDKWTVNIPPSYTGLVLVRLNNTTEVSWNAKWNQTSDIDFTNVVDNSTISITGWGTDPNSSTYSVANPQ